MEHPSTHQELHHEIFGSVLDRTEMTPYLLLPAKDYQTALKQAAKMMGNRGFDIIGDDELQDSEKQRALHYIEGAYGYFFNWMFPFVSQQFDGLLALNSAGANAYAQCQQSIAQITSVRTMPNSIDWSMKIRAICFCSLHRPSIRPCSTVIRAKTGLYLRLGSKWPAPCLK